MGIRTFEKDDLPTVVTINRNCLPENYPESFFLYIQSSFPSGFLIAEDEPSSGKKAVTGYVMTRVEYGKSNHSKFRLTKKGHIISLAVLPQYQRRGYARSLMEKALSAMKEAGATECFLEVRISNAPAIALYKSLGYSIVKVLRKYYADDESANLMSISLTDETDDN